jgi:HAD superfamily hydrolase (TIGR01509 family)
VTGASAPSSANGPSPYVAVLWDMDGTVVDTEPYWMQCEREMAEKYGGTWTEEDSLNLVGNDLLDSGRYIREHMGIDLEPAEIVEGLLDAVIEHIRREVPWRPGARELLADLNAAGVPCALVTMSYLRFVEPMLDALPPDTFATVVTGDAVERGKPYPDPYLKAARLLGLDPGSCLAIEDSDVGARSAEAAGCTVLCVPNHVPIPEGPGRLFADSLQGLTAANLPVRG